MARFRNLPCRSPSSVVVRSDSAPTLQYAVKPPATTDATPKHASSLLQRPDISRAYSPCQPKHITGASTEKIVEGPPPTAPLGRCLGPVDPSFCLSGTPTCACASPSCVASSTKTAARTISGDSSRSHSHDRVQRPTSKLQAANIIDSQDVPAVSRSPTAREVGTMRRTSSSVSPLPSPFLRPDDNRPNLSVRGNPACSSTPQAVMQGSKRRNATTVDAADVEKLDHTTRKHPQPSTVPESPQAKKRDQDIPPPSDHVDVQRKAPSLPQAKSMSKSTVTQKTTRSVSPVVQVPAKRKRAVSIAMSDDESSDSDAPLLKRPLREKPRTAAKRLKYRPTIRASSTMTPATAKKRPASRILRDTRARKERVNGTDEETEDDDSDDSDWQDDEANNLDVVRAWLKKKGLWRDAPGKVKRALW